MNLSNDLSVIILAAGKGKRMKSKTPKVLHSILGRPMLHYVLSTVRELNPVNIFTVAGYGKEVVGDYIRNNFPEVKIVVQENQLGTANAVYSVNKNKNSLAKNTIILSADTPLVNLNTLKNLVKNKEKTDSRASLVTAVVPDPEGYGRIIKDGKGNIVKIIEDADATPEEKKIKEVNTSIYCFETQSLFSYLKKIKSCNVQNEYYLTDIVEMLVKNGDKVSCFRIDDCIEITGINDRVQLSMVESIMQRRVNEDFMKNGVTIKNPESCYIESTVMIGKDAVIGPSCLIKGKTKIEENSVIGPFCQITDSVIGEGSRINSSVIECSNIGKNSNIGPYSYIKQGAVIVQLYKDNKKDTA
jgi:bifunctional UDP-N-acetylglucosamine pyrophosphorylase/glucosamine-1-phosphate N-acetyltransferase